MAAQQTHTPGPWQVDYQAYGDEDTGRVEGYEPSGDFLCTAGIVRLTDEANAVLVAAAPELLRALQGVKEWLADVPIGTPGAALQMRDVLAAIAKATGAAQ